MKTQHSKACVTLKRRRTEAEYILNNWALFESLNGFPFGASRDELRASVNHKFESFGIVTIQNLIVRDTILGLHRMIDIPNSERQTLATIRQFICQKNALEFLVNEARQWNPGLGLQDYNEGLVREIFKQTLLRLSEKPNKKPFNIGTFRQKISNLRNSELAHLLEQRAAAGTALRDIRHGVILVTSLIKKSSLLVDGYDWDCKNVWQHAFENADQFWDRYQKGYSA